VPAPPPGASGCVLAPSLCHHCPGAVWVGVRIQSLSQGGAAWAVCMIWAGKQAVLWAALQAVLFGVCGRGGWVGGLGGRNGGCTCMDWRVLRLMCGWFAAGSFVQLSLRVIAVWLARRPCV
jgi:hypothetical protein